MLIFTSSLALADCMAGSLSVAPAVGAEVPTRPELVLHAYGTERATVADLSSGDLALQARDGAPVPVEIVAVHRGSFTDTQVVFRPTAELPPGRYELRLRGEAKELWTGEARKPAHWVVTGASAQAPTWSGTPSVTSTDRTLFGCGPGVSVAVAVPVDAPWVEVSVARDGADPVTARAEVSDGRIELGHGMCSGMLELDEGVAYTARLTAVSASGQRASAPSEVRFTAP